MMWDIGCHGISNTLSDRNGSRSPHPPHIRMPSPSFPIPQSNSSTGFPFSSYPPPEDVSTSYNSYLYPSISRAAPAPPVIHTLHHSKHHSSSKNKHNDHHKHSGHGHSHSHSPHRMPSPTPFPIPSTSFSTPSPHVHFPAIPHRPLIHSRSTNALLRAPSHDYLQVQPPPPTQSTNHTHHKLVTKPKPHKNAPLPLNPDFQYSKCTGRRKALCIGINYRGQENELRGCVNDATNVRKFLLKNHYKQSEILLLTDDAHDPHMLPTYDNILGAMHWLVRSARPNDSLFFHYSGHGGQTRDLDGDEADGWDEVIFPLDYRRKGHIVDDLMHDIMVKPLPRGCRLTGLFDACHSGSVLDLPYLYSSHGRLKTSPITSRALASKATLADVISWSACQDGQTSADTFAGGVAVGAMSHAFIESLARNPKQTYQELFRSIRLTLNPRYSQKPQLGSSHQIDTNLRFIF